MNYNNDVNVRDAASKILSLDTLIEERARLKKQHSSVVFTNGCFDIIHTGHVQYLQFARKQGNTLIVGLNSDSSVKRAKGPARPVNTQTERALVLSALECVDYVVVFEEDEPADLIARILPDVLVKGEDWSHYVSGREIVEKNGGKVVLAPLVKNASTTNIIKRLEGTEKI